MSREAIELWPDALGTAETVIRYRHWRRAVLVFCSSWSTQLVRHMPRFC